MTRQSATARKAVELLGSSVVATAPVAGGDINTSTRLKLSDGRSVLMKTHPHAPEGFFAAEAAGLSWLGAASAVTEAVPVPDVLAVDAECLILPWIEPARPSADAAAVFGRRLAATHQADVAAYGAEQDGFIGPLPMRNTSAESWAEFYAVRRVLPYLKLGRDRGAATPEQAATIEAVVGRLPELLPEEGPSLLHGDLWNGNVLWGADGQAWAIDPAAYAGHREVDLAMLALFGLAHLERVTDAYREVYPLTDGWEQRVGLHQLFPLLVHACLFGGGYAARAAAIAEAAS